MGVLANFNKNSGFTVIELIVVLGLLALLAGISVPVFSYYQPVRRLNGGARLVLAELMWAKAKAVEENNPFVVSFPSSTNISVLDDNNGNGVADTGEAVRTRNVRNDFPGVSLAKTVGDPDPVFSSRGTAGGATTITVTNVSGSKIVTVGVTGVVKIN
jgi:type IV fimbrial biogenesis protein FimT